MSDDTVVTAVRDRLNVYELSVPDGELIALADAYSALRRAAERVLAAEPIDFDIAVTFDPSANR